MTAVLGPRPPRIIWKIEDFDERIVKRGGPCLVINDEAHHTHDEESDWNEVIRRLHHSYPRRSLLPNSTLPPHRDTQKVSYFTWTVYDYPLKQAIIDNMVKRPIKGIATGIQEGRSDIASTRYRAYLAAGVERWREYRDQLRPLGKKPILFVMMNTTDRC